MTFFIGELVVSLVVGLIGERIINRYSR